MCIRDRHNRGRLRVPWTFPPPTFEIADESADKSADKVCLDMCLTNLFKNADARAAKIVQNADKSCLPKLQTKFVCKIAAASECLGPSPQIFEIADKSADKPSRQGLSRLVLDKPFQKCRRARCQNRKKCRQILSTKVADNVCLL